MRAWRKRCRFLRRPWRLDRRARALGDCRGGGGLNHNIVYVSSNQSLLFSTYVTARRVLSCLTEPCQLISILGANAAFRVLKVCKHSLNTKCSFNALRAKQQRKRLQKRCAMARRGGRRERVRRRGFYSLSSGRRAYATCPNRRIGSSTARRPRVREPKPKSASF